MEKIEMTNMCMIYDDKGRVVVQEKEFYGKIGFTFPGGHVDVGESIVESTIREVKEETGLIVTDLEFCGIKNWYDRKKDYRYMVFLYKTNKFSGVLTSSDEGAVSWVKREEIIKENVIYDLDDMIKVFMDEKISEQFYGFVGDDWKLTYK